MIGDIFEQSLREKLLFCFVVSKTEFSMLFYWFNFCYIFFVDKVTKNLCLNRSKSKLNFVQRSGD